MNEKHMAFVCLNKIFTWQIFYHLYILQAGLRTYLSRVNFTVSSLWVATIIFAFLLCSISSNTYSKHLCKHQGNWLGFQTFCSWTTKGSLTIIQHSLVIHPVSGLIVRVYWVFVTNLFCPVSLLVHVGSTNQFGTKVPALPSGELNVHSYVVVGFLNIIFQTLFPSGW